MAAGALVGEWTAKAGAPIVREVHTVEVPGGQPRARRREAQGIMGGSATLFTLKGVTCGLMICYDSCFPEMYNRYRHAGVAITFHSYYNAHHKGPNILDEFIPAQVQTRAADNTMWVVANNSCARHSWPTSP